MIEKLLKFVEDYRASNPSGWRKLLFGVVAALAATTVLILLYLREASRQRNIASLRQERDLLREEARKHEVNAALENLDQSKNEHTAAANTALRQATELDRRVQILEAEGAKNSDIIDSLKSWDDVDARIR